MAKTVKLKHYRMTPTGEVDGLDNDKLEPVLQQTLTGQLSRFTSKDVELLDRPVTYTDRKFFTKQTAIDYQTDDYVVIGEDKYKFIDVKKPYGKTIIYLEAWGT